MKSTSLTNFFIIIGLLILCVMTLIAIYATAPESAVLLLEENFDTSLDENKWSHEISDCTENGEQFHYVTASEENGLITDGVLHIYPNLTDVHFRTKREAPGECFSCSDSENPIVVCNTSLFSAKLKTRNVLHANQGRVEIRAKVCCGDQIKLNIGISPNHNSSNFEETSEDFSNSTNEVTKNNSTELRVFFQLASNQTVLKSAIADNKFHIYEVDWDKEKISLSIDNQKVDEKKMREADSKQENISNTTVKLDSTPIGKPFYFNLAVGFEGQEPVFDNHSNIKRSADSLTNLNMKNTDVGENNEKFSNLTEEIMFNAEGGFSSVLDPAGPVLDFTNIYTYKNQH